MRYTVRLGGGQYEVDVHRTEAGVLSVWVDGEPVELDMAAVPGGLHLLDGTESETVRIGGAPERLSVAAGALRLAVEVETPRRRARKRRGGGVKRAEGEVRTPMPGRVVRVAVEAGQAVEVGELLAVVEAMKMENEFRAEVAGTVREVAVAAGQSVEAGALLVTIEPARG